MLPSSVHSDSSSTIEILKQENANKKTNKHIQIRLKSVLLGFCLIFQEKMMVQENSIELEKTMAWRRKANQGEAVFFSGDCEFFQEEYE